MLTKGNICSHYKVLSVTKPFVIFQNSWFPAEAGQSLIGKAGLKGFLKMSYRNRRSNDDKYSGRPRSNDSRFSNRPGFTAPAPIEAGKEYSVEIFELSRKGDGLAKIKGFVVFVKDSKVGDKVRIKIESLGPRFALASIVGPAENVPEEQGSKSSSSIVEPVE